MSDKSHKLYLDPDKVRKVELCHQPPGGRDRPPDAKRYYAQYAPPST